MKKLAIVVAVAALTMAGCSTVESIWTEVVPNTEEAVTTPLPDVVITEVVVEEAPAAE